MLRVARIALSRCVIASLGLLMLPSLLPAPAEAQYRARVYNPSVYNSNRALMNRRAAARAAELRKYCRSHPRAERCRARAKAAQRR
jgi:hypothetical protein